ncbi:hypothetical protein [Flocculibacter collagenilyticus]|uniref:hypothetical protein n=1 Tax=Flocculibacter collagenilyticus TaxID=2744479 RepID=UPI0018F78CB0|nr:hypothetical protein [Flocculibacter collagenilyticus]
MENTLIALGLLQVRELGRSMSQSRTLCLVVLFGILLFGGLILFLMYMAGLQK